MAGALMVAVVSATAGGAVTLKVNPLDSATAGAVAPAAAQGAAMVPANSVEQVAAKVVPSVVTLQSAAENDSQQGSGVILTSDGLILTNRHVVALPTDGSGGDPHTLVRFSDGHTATFSVVASDPATDLAVVRAQGVSALKPITLGTSADLRVGQEVVAVGSPLGLENTVTEGIVSALHRPVNTASSEGDAGTVLDGIQTDAALNPGNSGGALTNMKGELVGLNSAMAIAAGPSSFMPGGSIGLGFAIPVDQAKRIADELIRTGTASHASLGVQLNGDAATRGAEVAAVTTGGPAQVAGVPDGAVITEVDGRMIDGADALGAALASKAPGDRVALTYIEPSGRTTMTQVILGADHAQE
jgi:putative serine protease PepD